MPDEYADLPQPDFEGTVPVDDLEVDGDNPNEMTDDQFGLLCDRMRTNGWLGGPVVTDTDGLIADGEHRWRAAQDIGLSEVPVKQFDIDDATRRLWRQELNKIHGEHDSKRDALEYDYLLDAGKSDEVHDLVDAADEDLDELLAEIKVDTSMPPAYEYDPEHNVYFEDCVEGMAERLADDSVDCVITDPPYGIDLDLEGTMDSTDAVNHTGKVENDEFDDAVKLFRNVAPELKHVLSEDGHCYVFSSWKTYDTFRDILEETGFKVRNCIVWVKSNKNLQANFASNGVNYGNQHEFILYATPSDNSRPIDNYDTDVLEFQMPINDIDHPTQKPDSLISRLVENSTKETDTILDPFMGSGTTAAAAIQNDRDYVGFEVDAENYRDVIERRIGEAKRQVEARVNADE